MKQKVKKKSSKKKLSKDEFIRMLEKKPTKDQLKRLKVLDFIDIYGDDEHKDNILLADGLDEAFLGLAHRDGEHGKQVAVYGIYSCIYTLQLANKWKWVFRAARPMGQFKERLGITKGSSSNWFDAVTAGVQEFLRRFVI